MPRTGFNPNKFNAPLPLTPDITLAIVTHYTDHNYHKDRMDVVRRCVETMEAGVRNKNYELLIWDNGSTKEFRDMLREYEPTILVESANLGLDYAKLRLCHMARAPVFCYSDDDIEYTGDWYDLHAEILNLYPNVGLVSGSPQRVHFRWGIQSSLKFAQRPDARLNTGRLIPDEYEREYARGIGYPVDEHLQKTKHEVDFLLEYRGVKAWAHGHHMQFVARRKTILPFLADGDKLLADQRDFDRAIDDMGLLRLTTFKRTARHMGNVL